MVNEQLKSLINLILLTIWNEIKIITAEWVFSVNFVEFFAQLPQKES